MASSQDLDPNLWQHLPDEVLKLVLLSLPLEAIFRFCAVCKHWSNYFLSPSFRASCRQSTLQNPLLIELQSWEDLRLAPILTSYKKKWQCFNLSFLQQALLLTDNDCITGMYSDGGLLCVSAIYMGVLKSNNQSVTKFIVCNPLTQTCKLFPPIDKPFTVIFQQIIVRVEKPLGHYRIFIFGSDFCFRNWRFGQVIFLYNSKSNSVVSLPRITNILAGTCGAFQEEIFYTLSEDHELIAFDSKSLNWTRTNTGITMPDQANEYKILAHNGQLFCAIAKRGDCANVVEFHIYELKLATRQCVHLNIDFQCLFVNDSPGRSVESRYDWDFVVHRNSLLLVARSRAYDPRNIRWLEVFVGLQPFPSLVSAFCSSSEKGWSTNKAVFMPLMLSTLRLDLHQQVEGFLIQ